MDVSVFENQPYYQKSDLYEKKILQEDQSWMLPLPTWSHAIEHGHVEEINNIKPTAQKKLTS